MIMIRTEHDPPRECCLCGPSRFSRVLSQRIPGWETAFTLWRCLSCDLELLWPQPHGAAANLYDEKYYRNGYLAHEAERREQFREFVERLRQQGASGPLLDVGAGVGLLVSVARQENWIAEGIEPSTAACQLARQHYGIDIACRELTEVAHAPEFGVVVLWQVLAHVPNPLAVLQHAAKMLRPRGTLVLSSIHWGDPHYQFAKLLARRKKVNSIHIPTILWRFREKHLEELARRAGLRVVSRAYGQRAFREVCGWKKRLLQRAFDAYRSITRTNEEIHVWCAPNWPGAAGGVWSNEIAAAKTRTRRLKAPCDEFAEMKR